MIDIFSTREIAIGAWIIIALCWLFFNDKVRKSLLHLVRATFHWR